MAQHLISTQAMADIDRGLQAVAAAAWTSGVMTTNFDTWFFSHFPRLDRQAVLRHLQALIDAASEPTPILRGVLVKLMVVSMTRVIDHAVATNSLDSLAAGPRRSVELDLQHKYNLHLIGKSELYAMNKSVFYGKFNLMLRAKGNGVHARYHAMRNAGGSARQQLAPRVMRGDIFKNNPGASIGVHHYVQNAKTSSSMTVAQPAATSTPLGLPFDPLLMHRIDSRLDTILAKLDSFADKDYVSQMVSEAEGRAMAALEVHRRDTSRRFDELFAVMGQLDVSTPESLDGY